MKRAATAICTIVLLLMLCISGIATPLSSDNDTIPPTFAQLPQDTSILCFRDIQNSMLEWLTVDARAVAQDNSGEVEIRSTLNLEEMFSAYESNSVNFCGTTSEVSVGFYAIDPCENTSDTLFATFITEDPIDPQFSIDPEPLRVHCDATGDALIEGWLKNVGGSQAADACSETIQWEFFWPPNNVGTPDNGPFIELSDFDCNDIINVNFIAIDECDNTFSRQVNITIFDTIAPVFLDPISDVTVTCDNLEGTPLFARDNCRGVFQPRFTDISNQPNDPASCAYYNYEITRTWLAQDECGGEVSFIQNVVVIDNTVPEFEVPENVTIGCDQDISPENLGTVFNIMDNCDAEPSIEFTDAASGNNPCFRLINRLWRVIDACDGSSTKAQQILIVDSLPPLISREATNFELTCTDDIGDMFENWLADMAGAEAIESCSQIISFAAIPGTYNPNIPNTFPGDFPQQVDSLSCEDRIRTDKIVDIEVDFVFYDECENTSVTTARFIVADTDSLTVTTDANDLEVTCNSDFQGAFQEWIQAMGNSQSNIASCSNISSFIADSGSYDMNDATTFPGNLTSSITVEGCGDEVDNGILFSLDVDFVYFNECNEVAISPATFTIIDIQSTSLNTEASDISLSCESDYNQAFQEWIDNFAGSTINETCPISTTFAAVPGTYNINDPTTFPGTLPVTLEIDECFENLEEGVLQNIVIDFVFYDECGNGVVSQGNFEITIEEEAPITSEAQDLEVSCLSDVQSEFETWIDNNGGVEVAQSCALLSSFQAEAGSYDINDPSTFPGSLTSPMNLLDCGVNPLIDIDFVFFDGCNKAIASTASFSIQREEVTLTEAQNAEATCTEDFQTRYKEWLRQSANAFINEGCVAYEIFAAEKGSYTLSDPESYPTSIDSTITLYACDNIREDTLAVQNIDFIFFDGCEQALVTSASFTIINDSNLEFSQTNSDVEIEADIETCLATSSLTFPPFTFPCYDTETTTRVLINGVETPMQEDSIIPYSLSPDTHIITYIVSDCLGNVIEQSSNITVTSKPEKELTCGDDLTFTLPLDSCNLNIQLPQNFDIDLGCAPTPTIFHQSPIEESDAFLKFTYDEILDTFTVANIKFDFVGVMANAASDVSLNLSVIADMDEAGEALEIFGEDNTVLGEISDSECGIEKTFGLTIPKEKYNQWAEDGLLVIVARPKSFTLNVARGINPCTEFVQNENEQDGVSKMIASLAYTSFEAEYRVNGATSIDRANFPQTSFSPEVNFSPGISEVIYYLEFSPGTINQCNFNVEIIDDQNPKLSCIQNRVELSIFEIEDYILNPEEFTNVVDNCGISNLTISPTGFDCLAANTTFPVMISAEDNNGNVSQCEFDLTIDINPLTPMFVSGLCSGESISLDANIEDIPNLENFNLIWSGPNGFTSNEQNPVIANTSQANSGKYTLTITTSSGCTSSGSVDILIEDIQQPVITANAQTACIGTEITLQATEYGDDVTYRWYKNTVSENNLITTTIEPELKQTLEENNIFILVISNDNCESTSNPFEIIGDTPLTIDLNSASQVLCAGEELRIDIINPNPDVDYLWSGPNGLQFDSYPFIIPASATTHSGTYIAVASKENCNEVTASIDITINAKPDRPNISGQESYCNGSDAILTTQNQEGVTQYQWLQNNLSYQTTTTPTIEVSNVDESLEGEWKVIATNGSCVSDTSTALAIRVEENFIVTADSNSPLCTSDQLRLEATIIAGGTYQWSGPNGFSSTLANPTLTPIAGTYQVTVTDSNGCSSSTSIVVEVNALPIINEITIASDNSECLNGMETIRLQADVSPIETYTYTWQGPNGYISNDIIATIPNATSNNSGTYTLRISDGNCTSEPMTIAIDLQDELVISASSNSPLCDTDILSFEVTEFQDASYAWSGPNGFSSDASNPTTTPVSGSYNVTVTGTNGCSSMTSVNVDVIEEPIINDITILADNAQCLNNTQSFSLQADVPNEESYTYSWQGPSGFLSNERIATISNATAANNGTYTLRVTNGMCTSEPMTITIDLQDGLVISAQSNSPICDNEILNLNVNEFPDATYVWSGPNGFSSDVPNPSATPISGSYGVTVTDTNGCSSTATVEVNVTTQPIINDIIIIADNLECLNEIESFSLEADVPNGEAYSYSWQGPSGFLSNERIATIPNATLANNGTYTLRVTNGMCTSEPMTIEVDLQDGLVITAQSNSPICNNDILNLNVNEFPGATYVWAGPNGFSSDVPNPSATPISGSYGVTVTDTNGCLSTASVEVNVTTQPIINNIRLMADNIQCLDGTQSFSIQADVPNNESYTYAWEGPEGYFSNEIVATIPNATLANNGTYTLSVSNGMCISEPTTIDVNLEIVPPTPSIIGLEQACPGIPLEYIVENPPSNVDAYIWQTPRGQIITPTPNLLVENIGTSDVGAYSVQLMQGTCTSDPSSPIQLILNDKPDIPSIFLNGNLCSGNSLELFTDEISGATYEWRGPNNTTASGRSFTILNATPTNSGLYEVRISFGDCVSDWSEPYLLDISESGVEVPQLQPIDATICGGDTGPIQVCIDNYINEEYEYIFFLENEETILGTTTESCFLLENTLILEEGRNLIFAKSIRDNCESDVSPSIVVEVASEPTAIANAGDSFNACDEPEIRIVGNLPPNSSAMWSSPSEAINFENPDRPSTVISNLQLGENIVYYTLVDEKCGPYSQDTVSITLVESPELADDVISININEGVQVIDMLSNDFIPEDNYILEILESSPETNAVLIDDNKIQIEPARNLLGSFEIIYEVCGVACPNLCDMATIQIGIQDNTDCIATTLLTPNGDNINDAFVIPCLDTGKYPDNHLTIFNQWGDELYDVSPYQNEWTGEYNGRAIAAGTYYFVLTLEEGNNMSGFITVER